MKKKLLAIIPAGVMAASLLIGGATYALFTDSATNTGNTFTAGTLTMSTSRDDIPMAGPMFYTNDNTNGWSGTGLWAPGDSHTRGLFVRNTGSLDGKLATVSAIAEGSGTQYSSFESQADVTIAVFAPHGNFDQTAYRQLMQVVDNWYANARKNAWTNGIANVDDYINQSYLHQVFDVKNVLGEDVSASVIEVYNDKLSNLMSPTDVKTLGITVPSQETLLMGYTVSLPLTAGNDLQNKTVNFTFQNEFQQAKNN